ncbi:MAG: DUF4062 domain-containing protein [Candidatus Kapabacteria bacterium]|nr:DUF4062 domain-containing protein [Candidatus Kapabacteria bacterium]
MFITQPKIFISSTIWDLPNERTAAYNAVNKVGGFPVMSEKTMEAQSTDSLTACLSKVMESDIYVLILGGRYGWQPEGKESITEMEYQTARSQNIPILVINTAYPKEPLQQEFEGRVESQYFRKTVSDAFELEKELEQALKTEIDKKQNEYFNRTEPVYSNLVKIEFPSHIYIADLDIDKKAVKQYNKERKRPFYKPSLHDYAVSALYMQDISFPHDWLVWDGKIITFHNLQDSSVGLSKIIDMGTAEQLACDEFYDTSPDHLSQFKYLLKKCLEAKLHKLKIKWIKDEKLFAFLPVQKDDSDRWQPRSIEWTKTVKRATRKVVEIKRNLKNKEEVFNMRCLAFRTGFENFDNDWYLALKPEWIFLWPDFRVSHLAFKNIQWLKKTERNMHVFNHFNFILHYLQPPQTASMFDEYKDYPFLKLQKIEKFDFAPIVPDSVWNNLEAIGTQKKLTDVDGNVDLFGT